MAKMGIEKFISVNQLQIQLILRCRELSNLESIYTTARRIAIQLGDLYKAHERDEFLFFPGWGVDGNERPKPYIYFGRFSGGEIVINHRIDLFEDLVGPDFNQYHIFSQEDKDFMFEMIGDDEFYFPDHEFVSKI